MRTKLKLVSGSLLLGVLIGGGLIFAGCSEKPDSASTTKEKTLYTCGMHPQVIKEAPGNCPICGMKLTPVRKQAAVSTGERKIKFYKSTMIAGEVSPEPKKDSMGMDMVAVYEEEGGAQEMSTITIDPVTRQNMGLRSDVVTRGPLRRVIRTVGAVDFDETHMVDVTTKFKGWIEKLFVDTTGQQVHRGDPLFEIYSPELYSAQVEYTLALNQSTNLSGSDTLKASALAKLKFFDVSDEQIAELEKTRKPTKTLRVNSPSDGFVTEKMVVQGQMVDAGMKLYRIADLGVVWVQAQIYEQDLPFVQLGQEATVSLSYLPDRKFRGRVTYIYPTLDEKTRTAQVRMEFHNPGYLLKPGMFATMELRTELSPDALLVPDSAVLRSGEKNTVFVARDGGHFDPRTITLGPCGENNVYQVFSGLTEGERVVTSGQFMLDSESQLREAIQKMQNINGATSTPAAIVPIAMNAAPVTVAGTNSIYICPMPEHVSIQYDHPGKCPLCGMTLVPVSQATLDKIQPGGKILYYACPMTEDCPTPNHGTVHVDKPGKCPLCGMTLVPVMEMNSATNNVVEPLSEKSAMMQLKDPRAGSTNTVAATLPAILYTCPMHPEAVSDKPGDCPICGMKLVETSLTPKGKEAEAIWLKKHAAEHQP